jgi:hypothetical protein
MIKKTASDNTIAFTLYLTFNLISFVPLFFVTLLAGTVTKNPFLFILINSLLAIPVAFFALKYAIKSINKQYVITNKKRIVSFVLRYLVILNGLVILLNCFSVGYLSVSMAAGVFLVITAAVVIYKFAFNQLQESTPEEIATLPVFKKESSVLRQIGWAVLLSILGFIFLLIVPLVGFVFLNGKVGQIVWLALVCYLAITIFLFKKIFFNKK